MADEYEENDGGRKQTVEVGSGDFQPNPIYGDEPPKTYDGTTYEDDPNQMDNQQQQDAEYEYPVNNDNNNDNNNDDNNNDDDNNNNNNNPEEEYVDDDEYNNNQQQQQQQQEYGQQEYEQQEEPEQLTYGADGNTMQQQQQQQAPPPYSEDPPAPPQAYTDPDNEYGNDPEDVVAQMNKDNNIDNGGDEDVGDYGVTQPKTDDASDDDGGENGTGLFGNFFIRTVYMASSIFFASMLSFALWFTETGGDFSAGFGLSGFAAFMLFLGSIMALVYAIMKKMGRPIPGEQWVVWSIIGVYVTGGLFYFLGGCAVAYAYNTIGADYIAGIFFAEQTFVGLHGIVAGVDLWKRKILNNKKWRVIIYNLAFIILAVIGFFAYAVTSTTLDDAGLDNAGPAFLAFFYFLVLIPEILFLIIFLIPKLNETLGKPIVLLILAGSYLICVICILIGYFILVGAFAGLDQGRAYWIGVGFFVLLTGTIISFDMLFDRFIPGYKDGGESVSDQQSNGNGGSAVPTNNPDSGDNSD